VVFLTNLVQTANPQMVELDNPRQRLAPVFVNTLLQLLIPKPASFRAERIGSFFGNREAQDDTKALELMSDPSIQFADIIPFSSSAMRQDSSTESSHSSGAIGVTVTLTPSTSAAT
jgi:hypothetical protein